MKILITGVAGFIGMHCAKLLLERGNSVVGVDNLNAYYDIKLKQARLTHLVSHAKFSFFKGGIEDSLFLEKIFQVEKPDCVINLAAQAGVRYSLENPITYIDSNILGFVNVLECCRAHRVSHLVYASSSSVYGGNEILPFAEHHNVDHPLSLYAATKKSNELIAHTYSHLFGIPSTGLRFFTVYGPWGRPDMALFKFTERILKGEPIDVFNNGDMTRDFTYIDDIAEGVVGVLEKIPSSTFDLGAELSGDISKTAPYRIFNIGNGNPTSLMDFIAALETSLGLEAKKKFLPIQDGDVPSTSADNSKIKNWIGLEPKTKVNVGVERFVKWYAEFYGVKINVR